MSYSVVFYRIKNNLSDREKIQELNGFQSLVNDMLKNEFLLHGELKYEYINDGFLKNGLRVTAINLLLCQAVYKYDEVYNSDFFESISKTVFETIPKELATVPIIITNNGFDATFNVDKDKEHVLLPQGDLTFIKSRDGPSNVPLVFQNFYKIKKEDLNPLYYNPDNMESSPELIAAKERFDAAKQTMNKENKVGGYKRKTNKKRKQRMRKTKHKW